MSGKSKEHVCPHCGKSFVKIGNHKCKMAPTPTHDTDPCKAEEAPDSNEQVVLADTRPEMNGQFQKESLPPADGMSQCAKCKKSFKQLSKHKCKMAQSEQDADSDGASRSKAQVVPVDTGTAGDLAQDGKSQCPSCKRYFKQLSKHKCNVVKPADAEGACASEEQVEQDALVGKDADGKKHQCPSCNEYFKQLCRHKCKSEERVPNACAKDEILDQFKTDPANGKMQCLSCKQYFKQLSRHNCKVPQSDQHTDDQHKDAEKESVSNYSSNSPACYETGRQPVINTGKLDAEAVDLMESLGIDHASRPVRSGDDFFDKEVKLEQEEKSFAKGVFHPFRNKIKEKLNESTCWLWDWLLTGSYADGTKVTRPDEIDIMWHPDTDPAWLEPVFAKAPLGYCFLKLSKLQSSDSKYKELEDLCTKDGLVSSEKFRNKTCKIFEAAIKEKRKARKDPASKEGSPSYAVLLDTVPGKPPISIDLVPCLHLKGWPEVSHTILPSEVAAFVKQQGYDVIPKDCKEEKYGDVKHLLWRLSFSRSEKRLTNYADGKLRKISEAAPKQSDCPVTVPPSPSVSIDSGLSDRTDSFVSDADCDVSVDLQTREDAKPDTPDTGSKQAVKKKKPPPTCRKSVLRMLKRILEIIKRFDNSRSRDPCPAMESLKDVVDALHEKMPDFKIEKFTTFQIRTLMWTEYYVTNPGDALWTREKRRARLSHALTQLKKMVSGRMYVTHFFLPDLDIMADCTLKEREFLYIIFTVAEKLF